MRILITGGAGRVGAAVVERLSRAGHELTVIGRTHHAEVKGARYRQCDILDITALIAAAKEADTIVHLAAIPAPTGFPPEEVFRANCQGTFNVYEAAARAGIKKLVSASSINAVGYNYGNKPFPIAYLPVDEQMPVFSTDAYSFSKQITERIGEYAWRRDGITSVGLRLPWVAPAVNSSKEIVMRHATLCRASYEALLTLSEAERLRKVQGWVEDRNRYRATRDMEALDGGKGFPIPDPLVVGYTDFWVRIDERDSAQAIDKALSAEYEGYHTLFVNDNHSYTGVPSLALSKLFFPEAKLHAEKLSGTSSVVSVDAARKLIGFAPEFSVGRWL
jgi:NAD(P)-dependent dehydrogenase (short-subunit alcohol dehydrogenase family)